MTKGGLKKNDDMAKGTIPLGNRLQKRYRFHFVWWWLRSPRNNSNNVADVNTDGTWNNNNAYNTTGAVRPDLPRPV